MQKHFLRLIGFLHVPLLCRRLLDDPPASDKKMEEMGGKCPHRKVKKRRLLNPKFLWFFSAFRSQSPRAPISLTELVSDDLATMRFTTRSWIRRRTRRLMRMPGMSIPDRSATRNGTPMADLMLDSKDLVSDFSSTRIHCGIEFNAAL